MRKRIITGALLVLLSLGLVIAFSGCEWLAQTFSDAANSIQGTVIDARSTTGAAVSGMSLTLTSKADPTYTETATTDSSGAFSFTGLTQDNSPFFLTGTADISGTTYTLIKQTVVLDGLLKDLGTIPAIALSVDDANVGAFTYILMWPKSYNSSYWDLDLHMTFDTTAQSKTAFALNDPYGNESGTGRTSVYYSNKIYPTGATGSAIKVNQDVDSRTGSATYNAVPGVETISIRSIPIDSTDAGLGTIDNTASPYVSSVFGAGYNYKWAGYASAYVNYYTTDPVITDAHLSDVAPVLYVIQSYFPDGTATADKVQSNAKADLLGIFPLPDTTVARAAKMVRTDFFYDDAGYQLFLLSWDGAFYDGPDNGSTFKALDGRNFIAGMRVRH